MLTMPFCGIVKGQDTLSGQVVIASKYRPQVRDAKKLMVPPQLENPTPKTFQFLYTEKPTAFGILPGIPNVKPLAFSNPKPEKLYGNYGRFGFGNFSSPLAEISISNLRSNQWALGTQARHYSLNGKTPSRKWSETDWEGWMKYYTGTQIFTLNGQYSLQSWRHFGLPQEMIDTLSSPDSLKHGMQSFQLDAGLEKPVQDPGKTSWSGNAAYRFMIDRYTQQEHLLLFNGGSRFYVHDNPLGIQIKNQIASYQGGYSLQRTLTELTADYTLKDKAFKLKLGFSAYFETNGLDTPNGFKFYFFPQLQGEYEIQKDKILAFINLDGQRTLNTLQQFYLTNPYLRRDVFLDNHHVIRFQGGLRGRILSKTAWYLSVGSLSWNQAPLFIQITDTVPGGFQDPYRRFQVYYRSYHDLQLRGEISHAYLTILESGLSTVFHRYTEDGNAFTPSHLPKWEARFYTRIRLQDKIRLSVDLNAMGARQSAIGDLANRIEKYEKLKSIADISIGADYTYSKHVGLWLKIHNLTASRYQRWYQYPVTGFNFHFGLKITL